VTIVPQSIIRRNLSKDEGTGHNPEGYGSNDKENMRRDGERVWVAWTNKAMCDESGKVREILCVGNDITGRKQMEEELRKSESRFRMLLDTMNEGVSVQDERGIITYANDKLCRILGHSGQFDRPQEAELYRRNAGRCSRGIAGEGSQGFNL